MWVELLIRDLIMMTMIFLFTLFEFALFVIFEDSYHYDMDLSLEE